MTDKKGHWKTKRQNTHIHTHTLWVNLFPKKEDLAACNIKQTLNTHPVVNCSWQWMLCNFTLTVSQGNKYIYKARLFAASASVYFSLRWWNSKLMRNSYDLHSLPLKKTPSSLAPDWPTCQVCRFVALWWNELSSLWVGDFNQSQSLCYREVVFPSNSVCVCKCLYDTLNRGPVESHKTLKLYSWYIHSHIWL